MKFLIDGYNLLHALGLLRTRAGPNVLRKARLGLLGLLKGAMGDEASSVTVIFDADPAPPGLAEEEDYEGIHIRYAVHEAEADDLIEDLIQRHPIPQQLSVVSDDHRLQRTARRRDCKVLGCGDFLDWLEQRRKPRPAVTQESNAKPEGVSKDELRDWLKEFSELENDPNLRALSEPREWEEIDE